MSNSRSNLVLKKILEKLELPEGAYEKAEKRYNDIGEWLHRPESSCLTFDPLVFSQGSFRLGTAIKPEDEEEYDLDMGCKLRDGLTKDVVTQKQLKELLGRELELYRKARNIKEKLSEKKRCWRLDYADGLSFHMDIVPCIPESDTRREVLKDRMVEATRLDDRLASDVSDLAVSITDNTDAAYSVKTNDWRVSNPEGYARWFETRMREAEIFLAEREAVFKASINTLPYYRWKTPLQSVIQLLKRHRDTMFKENEDSKPISVIITTLAGRAYKGEGDVASALINILSAMDVYINQSVPLVPNPVNPDEDFADKWYSEEGRLLKLRESFSMWLIQARADFSAICSIDNGQIILDAAERGLSINLDRATVERDLGIATAYVSPISHIDSSNPKPWFKL